MQLKRSSSGRSGGTKRRTQRPNYPMTPQSPVKDVPPSAGLTSDEARRRIEKFGPNTIPDTTLHPLRRALAKFWAPVPWMLEAAIMLEIVLGKYVEAAIIAVLLAFNAAQSSLSAIRLDRTQRLSLLSCTRWAF